MKNRFFLIAVSLVLVAGCVGSADEPVDPPADEKPAVDEKKSDEQKAADEKKLEGNVETQGVKDHSV